MSANSFNDNEFEGKKKILGHMQFHLLSQNSSIIMGSLYTEAHDLQTVVSLSH